MFSTKRSVLQYPNVGGSIRKPTERVRADAALEVTPLGFGFFYFIANAILAANNNRQR